MSDHPTTFKGESQSDGPAWNDPSTLHRSDDGGGVLYRMKAVRSGTLAELVRSVMALPEGERAQYCIEKNGDHRLDYAEIAGLAHRPDFPAAA